MKGIRLLIVDDHSGFRRVARAVLERDGYEVVGEAADGASAMDLARDLRPDLVLLDIVLPDMDGFVVCRRLNESPHPPEVILTSSRDPGLYRQSLEASSALGFIPKSDLSAAAVAGLLAGAG